VKENINCSEIEIEEMEISNELLIFELMQLYTEEESQEISTSTEWRDVRMREKLPS